MKPGAIHYLGTYKYIPKKAQGLFSFGSFELDHDQSRASHADVLTWLEEATRETKWHASVQRRLAETGRGASRKK